MVVVRSKVSWSTIAWTWTWAMPWAMARMEWGCVTVFSLLVVCGKKKKGQSLKVILLTVFLIQHRIVIMDVTGFGERTVKKCPLRLHSIYTSI